MNKIFIFIAMALLINGCSGKESFLVPGQSESDCDEKASNLGVCGTPKTVYKHQDKIKNIWFEDGEGYFVNKNGKIFNVETQEEVIPGQRPDGCNNAICPNCDEVTDDEHEHTEACLLNGHGAKKFSLKNRSMIIDTPQKTTMMRDLGWQQKIWIAPMKTKGDDLIEAHGIHVVIKKASWLIGEEVPRNIKRGVVVPSILTKEVLTDNHFAIERTTNKAISDYVETEKHTELKSIQDYIKTQKGN